MNKEDSGNQIAIIGMAVNFPGANNKQVYWHNICSGVDSTGRFPKSREQELQPYQDVLKIDKNNYKNGGYLNDVSSFDYNYFKIPKIEAILMQPAQRLFMENALTAIEDAGYGGDRWYGKKIGVYVGSIGTMEVTGYQHIIKKMNMTISPTGMFSSGIAGRLSYFMNFTGESVGLDSACSSSFAALKYACGSLKNYECDGAVVGGVQLSIYPDTSEYSVGVESLDGHTKAFDVKADGTGVSEGVCTIVLKRLADALSDRDHIYGVVCSVRSKQDGRSLGLAAPNPRAQTDIMRELFERDQIRPKDISYMELHGTGTKLGDAIELKALNMALELTSDSSSEPIPIGSVKANIGHTFACSGLAGLIKCCMMMENRKICPQINFSTPSYEDKKSRFKINRTLTEFPLKETKLTCIISNFGLSGTNYVCAISNYNEHKKSSQTDLQKNLFVLSAKTKASMEQSIEEYIGFFNKDKSINLSEVCYTASARRGHYEHRLAIICESVDEIIEALRAFHFCSNPEYNTYYSYAKRLTDPRQTMGFGEINEESYENLNKEVEAILTMVLNNDGIEETNLKRIASCYVSGANVNWDKMYSNQDVYSISMPTYAFDKIKCWPE